MKRLLAIFFLCLVGVGAIVLGVKPKETPHREYLRIHIRANSNLESDQNVKYKVKDKIVEYLTPILADLKTKDEVVSTINKKIYEICGIANQVLAQNNLSYCSSACIKNEYFPVRSYGNVTLESGYYDALIVNLGSGEGDNWWCVVYPPLCFLNTTNYVYKSRLANIIQNFWR